MVFMVRAADARPCRETNEGSLHTVELPHKCHAPRIASVSRSGETKANALTGSTQPAQAGP